MPCRLFQFANAVRSFQGDAATDGSARQLIVACVHARKSAEFMLGTPEVVTTAERAPLSTIALIAKVQAVYRTLDDGNARTIQHAVECGESAFTCTGEESYEVPTEDYYTASKEHARFCKRRNGSRWGAIPRMKAELDKDTQIQWCCILALE
jgi:hypothetical protein